jgi:hypothetical protein
LAYSTEKIQRKILLQEKKALQHTLSLIASEREKKLCSQLEENFKK